MYNKWAYTKDHVSIKMNSSANIAFILTTQKEEITTHIHCTALKTLKKNKCHSSLLDQVIFEERPKKDNRVKRTKPWGIKAASQGGVI